MSASEPPPLPPPHRRPLFTLFTLPLSLTKRIRLTCFDLSPSLLVVGTATGSVYYYHRPSLHAAFASLAGQLSAAVLLPLSSPFASRPHLLSPPTLLRLLTLGLPPASASLTRVSLCPQQPELLALATASSLLILHCPPHSSQQRERLIHRLDSPHISHLTWTTDDTKRPVLWSADNDGQLMRTVVVVGGGGGVGLGQRVTTEVVCKLDSAIVQLASPRSSSSSSASSSPAFLLVSTLTRSYIVSLPTASTPCKAQPIGSKPRKEAFTACLDPSTATTSPHILASRPGKRIWRSDMSGTVLSTLIIQPPSAATTFAPCASSVGCELPATFAVSSVQYSQLSAWCGGVVVWSVGSGWWMYVDVGHVCVVDWMVGLGRVMDVRCDGSECWLMHDREDANGAAALDDAVDISLVYSSSPYSHIQRLLSPPSASATLSSPLTPLVHFATKHRIYDRQLLTTLQQRTQQQPLDPPLQQQFDALIVDAERAERLSRREEYWDDKLAAQQQQQTTEPQPPSAASAAGAVTGAAGGGGEMGGLAGVRSALSSAAQLVGKLAQPQLGGKDNKVREKEKEKDTMVARPASPKPSSFLERTSALFSSTPAAAVTTPHATPTITTVITPAEQPNHALANGTAKPPSTSRSTSPAPSLDAAATQAEAPHSGKPSPINPFLLSSSTTTQPPKLTASSSFSSTASTSTTSSPVQSTSTLAGPSDVFARASLLPADNLPFAEAVEEAGAVREERKAEGTSGKKRRVVDVGAAGDEERRERQRRRREKREAERKKKEKEEREKQRLAQAALATLSSAAVDAHTNAETAAEKQSGELEVKEEPAADSLSTEERKQSDGDSLTSTGDEARPSTDDAYPSPSDTEEEGGDGETATDDEVEVEVDGDDVTLMLHPSSTSLFAGMPTSPLASLLPCLQSMRWTLTAASIACREADVSFSIIEGEDVARLRQQRWLQAQLPSLPTRRETAEAVSTDSENAQQSVWSAVSDWLSGLRVAVQHCDALSMEATEGQHDSADKTGDSQDEYGQRIHRLHGLLASYPPLLAQELTALLTLHCHLLLMSPHTEDVSSFLLHHRSLLDRLTVYSLLRHYHHPLCFALIDIFPPTGHAERPEVEGLPTDPILLAAASTSLLSSPSAALAAHVASVYPHCQPWMLIDRLDLASSLSSSALHTTSPIPLVAELHPSLPSVAASSTAASAKPTVVDRSLNFYRAYLDHLLHSAASPSHLKHDRSLTDPFLYLSLRLGCPVSPPTARTTVASLWPFSPSVLSMAAQPSMYGFSASELVDVFGTFGYWCGVPGQYVRLLLSAPTVSMFECAVAVVLQLDDVRLMAELLAVLASSALDLPTRLTYAQAALAVFVNELADEPPVNVSLSHILHPLLLALGPPLLLQLLMSLPPTSPVLTALPASFHTHLLAHSQRLHTLSRQVTAVIDTVDSYLWSERPAALPPQLRRGGGGGTAGRRLHVWAEDAGGVDWGLVVSGGENDGKGGSGVSCGCCGVRIEWSERLSEAVVCFACDGGHVYHRQCLPELACVLCLMKNMRAAVQQTG